MDEINIQMLVNNDGLTSGQQEIQTKTLMKNSSNKPSGVLIKVQKNDSANGTAYMEKKEMAYD